jgi:hypothetical protein
MLEENEELAGDELADRFASYFEKKLKTLKSKARV